VGHSAKTTPKCTNIHDNAAPSRTVIENCNRLFYSESTAASCLHMRELCSVSLQRLQRLYNSSPASTRALFFALSLLPRAKDSLRVVSRSPSLAVRVPSYCICFFLRALYYKAALLAASSSALRFVSNTIKYAIIAAPLLNFSIALTINISELSIYL
jgi:hypothetical protein